MKRRSFLSGLFVGGGVAPAAVAGSSYLMDGRPASVEFVNGKCPNPACGQMAHPYQFDAMQPQTRLVRCRRCSTAFFQDQEEPGEKPEDAGPGALELKREGAVL